MAEIDYKQVFDGVTLALHNAFPKAHIHGGIVKQNLHNGDFNVLPIAANHAEQMGVRAQRKCAFDVIYYQSDNGGREESLKVAHRLAYALRTIQTPNCDKVHCLSFETTIDDDVLHCLVGYPHFVYAADSADSMEKIEL